MNQPKTIRVGVAVQESNGAPNFVFYELPCTPSQIHNGVHYDLAMEKAEDEGYKPKLAFDATDPAWGHIKNSQRDFALTALLKGLEDLGFGTGNEIEGADAVQAIAELYADVTGRILKGSVETHNGGTDHYLLIMMGDVEPMLHGPFPDDFERMQSAKEFREVEGDDHGLYRLDVPKGVVPIVDSFTGGEMQAPADPLIKHILEKLSAGEEVIGRPLIPGALYFTVCFEGDEAVFNLDMLKLIEVTLKDKLVLVQRTMEEVLVTSEIAAKDYPKEDWQHDVANGDTNLGYAAWLEHNIESLPLAASIL